MQSKYYCCIMKFNTNSNMMHYCPNFDYSSGPKWVVRRHKWAMDITHILNNQVSTTPVQLPTPWKFKVIHKQINKGLRQIMHLTK